MWPWSTIRRLKEALAAATGEADLWKKSYNRAWGLYEGASARQAELLVKYGEFEKLGQRWTALNESYEMLAEENRDLRELLATAAKNDARDPKTGRFVKAESAAGQFSGEIGY